MENLLFLKRLVHGFGEKFKISLLFPFRLFLLEKVFGGIPYRQLAFFFTIKTSI